MDERDRHLALVRRVRDGFSRSEPSTLSGSDRPLLIARRRDGRQSTEAVAFLACLTHATTDFVYPVFLGENRIGRDPNLGDFDALPGGARLLEPRQWLVVAGAGEVTVTDDRTTNLSSVLARSATLPPAAKDPRQSRGTYSYSVLHGTAWDGRVDLAWGGATPASLQEGDVLLAMYAAFVFGTLR